MAQLRHKKEDLDQLDTRVAVVTFNGREDWAQRWLKETRSPFPMLLDSERDAYAAYGLQRSLWRAWNLRTLWFYTKQLMQGETLHGVQGDSGQLGGDFIIDAQGTIRMAYYSDDPTDRPALDGIFDTLRMIQGERAHVR